MFSRRFKLVRNPAYGSKRQMRWKSWFRPVLGFQLGPGWFGSGNRREEVFPRPVVHPGGVHPTKTNRSALHQRPSEEAWGGGGCLDFAGLARPGPAPAHARVFRHVFGFSGAPDPLLGDLHQGLSRFDA